MNNITKWMPFLLGLQLVLNSPTCSQISATGRTNVAPFPGGDGLQRGDSASIRFDKTVLQRASSGTNWLLAIGVSQYLYARDWKTLKNPINDARRLKDILVSQYGYRAKNIVELYNGAATRDSIYWALGFLTEKIKPGDNLLIFFAGHGIYSEDLTKAYLIPADARRGNESRYLDEDDFKPYLMKMNARSVLIVSDACFSGAIYRSSEPRSTYNDPEAYFQKVSARKARQAITSGGKEPVIDGGLNSPHSVFAYFVLRALEENRSPFFAATTLFEAIREDVANRSPQNPELLRLRTWGDEGGEFIFYKMK